MSFDIVQMRYSPKLSQNLASFYQIFAHLVKTSHVIAGYQYGDYHQYVEETFSFQKSGESLLITFRKVHCSSWKFNTQYYFWSTIQQPVSNQHVSAKEK